LDPDPRQLAEMNNIIEDFVTRNIVISKERIYMKPEKGGLGMIKLDHFLDAQKCSWIRRCYHKINDAWRWEFLERNSFHLDCVRLEFFYKDQNPILWSIANSVVRFQKKYWERDENYLVAPIFNNNFFLRNKPRGRGDQPVRVDTNLLRPRLRNDFREKILGMKMGNLLEDGRIVDFNTIIESTGVPFSQNEYLMLVTAATYAREKYGNKPESNGKHVEMLEGVYSKKLKSKLYRRYLERGEREKSVCELQVVKTFFSLTALPVPDSEIVSTILGMWNR